MRSLSFILLSIVFGAMLSSCSDETVEPALAEDAQSSMLTIAVTDQNGNNLLNDEMLNLPFSSYIALEYCGKIYEPEWNPGVANTGSAGWCDPVVGRPDFIDNQWRPETSFVNLQRVATADGNRLIFGGFDNRKSWRRQFSLTAADERKTSIEIENRIEVRSGKATAVRYISTDDAPQYEGDEVVIRLSDSEINRVRQVAPGSTIIIPFMIELVNSDDCNAIYGPNLGPGAVSYWGSDVDIKHDGITERLSWDNISDEKARRLGYDWPSALITPGVTSTTILTNLTSGIFFNSPTLVNLVYTNDYEQIETKEHIIVLGGYTSGHHEIEVVIDSQDISHIVELDIDTSMGTQKVAVTVDGVLMPDAIARINVR